MQDSNPNLNDIAIPETVEVAIMQWWNSGVNSNTRDCSSSEAYRRLTTATEAVKVALLSLATNPVIDVELIYKLRNQWDAAISGAGLGAYNPFTIRGYLSEVFLRKPDPVPAEVKALMWGNAANPANQSSVDIHNKAVREAVEIGKRLEREARDADKH